MSLFLLSHWACVKAFKCTKHLQVHLMKQLCLVYPTRLSALCSCQQCWKAAQQLPLTPRFIFLVITRITTVMHVLALSVPVSLTLFLFPVIIRSLLNRSEDWIRITQFIQMFMSAAVWHNYPPPPKTWHCKTAVCIQVYTEGRGSNSSRLTQFLYSSNLDLLPVTLHWFCNPAASKQNHTSRTPQSAADSQSLLPTYPKASDRGANPLRGSRLRESAPTSGSYQWWIYELLGERIIFVPPLLLSHQIWRDSNNTWRTCHVLQIWRQIWMMISNACV